MLPPLHGIPAPGGFCFDGDPSRNQECLRDLEEPKNSSDETCLLRDAVGEPRFTGCPSDYMSPDYCVADRDCGDEGGCCEEHRNSTVFSHWFYLVARGNVGTNFNQCDYVVSPLSASPEESVRKALQVAFTGIRDYLVSPWGGYRAMANATIDAAKSLYGEDSPEVRAVASAWYAVNVRENFLEDDNAKVQPPRSAASVDPWQWFVWPRQGEETSWDFQLYAEAFIPGLLQHEAYDVKGVIGATTRRIRKCLDCSGKRGAPGAPMSRVSWLSHARVVRERTGVGFVTTVFFPHVLPSTVRQQWDWNFSHASLRSGGSFVCSLDGPKSLTIEGGSHAGDWPKTFDPSSFLDGWSTP